MKVTKEKANKVPVVAEGTIIEITHRTCSEKLQKNIKVGNKFVVAKVTSLKNGTPAIEVKNPIAVGKVMRINAERFKWRAVTMEEIQKAEAYMRIQADGRAKNAIMKQKFSDYEIDHILFTPYIYELLAWHYVGLCHKCAAENGLDFRKVSRMAVEARKKAEEEGSFELGPKVYSQFVDGVAVMTDNMQDELTRIWWQANGEIKRAYPEARDVELKSYALCGMLALRLLDAREDLSDNLIKERLGSRLTYSHNVKRSVVLHQLLEAYADEAARIDYDRLELASRVMRNNIECIKFTTLHNEFRQNY